MAEEHELLELRGIVKQFPGSLALDSVDFTLKAGEIHALMGENGAGKSTLIKVLTGVYPRDAGTVMLDGKPFVAHSPLDATLKGISTVYQEVNLIPGMTVAQNVSLGRVRWFMGLVAWWAESRRAKAALRRLGVDIDVTRPLSSYSVAIQQMVAIARAVDIKAKVLILDEPTSSLDDQEVKELFAVMRKLASEGMGIVFVTHFMNQVYAVTNRITVLRNGKLVGSYATAELPKLELIGRMMGREAEQVSAVASGHRGAGEVGHEVVLAARGLGKRGMIRPYDLDVKKGEVVGLAGLLGSGRTEAVRLMFGLDKPDSGTLAVGPGAAEKSFRSVRKSYDALAIFQKSAAIIVFWIGALLSAIAVGTGAWVLFKSGLTDTEFAVLFMLVGGAGLMFGARGRFQSAHAGNAVRILMAFYLAFLFKLAPPSNAAAPEGASPVDGIMSFLFVASQIGGWVCLAVSILNAVGLFIGELLEGVMRIKGPRAAVAHGMGFCPEDRKVSGIVPDLSVRENIMLVLQNRRGWWRRIGPAEQNKITRGMIKALNIKTADAETPIKFLSGGNQQKAILARWLVAQPNILILDEPTRGIDVGAKFEIAKEMETLRKQGMSIIFISSELEEVARSCQRVAVMRDRVKVGELAGDEISEGAIMNKIAHSAVGAGG